MQIKNHNEDIKTIKSKQIIINTFIIINILCIYKV
jgi:hypothetical protein